MDAGLLRLHRVIAQDGPARGGRAAQLFTFRSQEMQRTTFLPGQKSKPAFFPTETSHVFRRALRDLCG